MNGQNLASEYKHVTANVTALLPAEWDAWLPVRCKELRLESEHRFSPLVLLSGDAYLGGDQELAAYARKHFAYFESSQAEGARASLHRSVCVLVCSREWMGGLDVWFVCCSIG